MIQIKFPPFSAKSVHPSVNLPLKKEKTLVQIASKNEIHPTQLKNWRAFALEGLPGLFEKQDSTTELRRVHEQQLT